MRIHCDYCGTEIEKDKALTYEMDNGDILHFCSEECLESLEHHETMQDPGREEEGAAGDLR
ncbi:MAG TPA: TRASH domain-containing protein [Planctomycetota bacterium]|nr:TRASH domain-containing protein [Planctomycetota bacterium]